MKRLLITLISILFMFVSCTYTDINPVNREVGIGYNTVVGKTNVPGTKTLASNQRVFNDANVFQSYAYYLPIGTAWTYSTNPGDNGAQSYFNTDVIIKKDATANLWKDPNNDWYWPKTYALTFFAWSLNAPNLDFPAGSPTIVECTDQNGIVAMYYDIESNKNVDFLVADIAADKTANENVYTYLGVPTVFKHKLSQFHATVSEKEDYDSVGFTLDGISFQDLNKDGNYTQRPDVFTLGSTRTDQVFTSTSQDVTSTTPTDVTDIEQYIYLPQAFDDDKTVTITYTIHYDTDGDGVYDLDEPVTVTYKLSELFGPDGFKPGTKYTLNIIFKMDEIYWDPAVEDWDNKSTNL